MRLVKVRPGRCDRAREWISRDVDGELSEIERALLSRHVSECAACAEFRHDVESLASVLRTAPLERPKRPFELPRRRRVAVRPLQAAAALAIAAAGLGSLVGSLGNDRVGSSIAAARLEKSVEMQDQGQRNWQDTRRILAMNPRLISHQSPKRPGRQLL